MNTYSITNCICVFLSNIYSFYLNLFFIFNGFVISCIIRWSINVSVLCDNNVRWLKLADMPPVSGVGIIWQTECNLGWPLTLIYWGFALAKYLWRVRNPSSQLKGLQFSAGLYFLVKLIATTEICRAALSLLWPGECRPGDKPWIGTLRKGSLDNDLNLMEAINRYPNIEANAYTLQRFECCL